MLIVYGDGDLMDRDDVLNEVKDHGIKVELYAKT